MKKQIQKKLNGQMREAHGRVLKIAKRERWPQEKLEKVLAELPGYVRDKFRRDQDRRYWSGR